MMKIIIKIFMTGLTLSIFMGTFAVVHSGQELNTKGAMERIDDQARLDRRNSIDNYYSYMIGKLKVQDRNEMPIDDFPCASERQSATPNFFKPPEIKLYARA